jgi:arylsulfatase A-like enzyme
VPKLINAGRPLTRREFVEQAAVMGAGAPLLLGKAHGERVWRTADNRKPNIIFILADDLGYGDLACYGQQRILTPNIDRLATEGIRFTQAYSGSTVCAPSRCSLMTGLHTGHSAVRDNVPHYHTYLQADDVTVAEILKRAGYHCGGIGKWSLGDPGTVGRATNQGFDSWFGYLNQDHAHYYYPEYLDDDEGVYEMPGNAKTRKYYSHDLMVERALEFIRRSKKEPFFLYGAFTLPHFSSESEDPSLLPVPSDAPYSDKNWSRLEKNYAAMVSRLDRDVGRIAGLVEELGLTQNTLIIFTSDNGPWEPTAKAFRSNGNSRGFKRDVYEGGIRAPFIARWPGNIPAGGVSEQVIAGWDILPTFSELAGGTTPKNIDGISVVNALFGRTMQQAHEYLYWDYGHNRETYSQAVRMGDWKGVRNGQKQPIELYYLANDPGEQKNIAGQYPRIVRDIELIMKTATTPSDRYPIGKLYKGSPIWKKSDHW